MIIFLDDNKRPEWYGLKSGKFFHFTDGDRALLFCKEAPIDVLYLDHELGNSMRGYHVLLNLIQKFKNPPKTVVCISMDVLGICLIEALCKKFDIPYEYLSPPDDAFMDIEHYG